jgi:hypothetical protein
VKKLEKFKMQYQVLVENRARRNISEIEQV